MVGAVVSGAPPRSKKPEPPTRKLLKRFPSWPASRPRSVGVRSKTPSELLLPGFQGNAWAVVGLSAASWLRYTALTESISLGLTGSFGSVLHPLAVPVKFEVYPPGYTAPSSGAAQKWPPTYTAASVTAREKMLEYMRADQVNGWTALPAVS